jgi:hypothetical protein
VKQVRGEREEEDEVGGTKAKSRRMKTRKGMKRK